MTSGEATLSLHPHRMAIGPDGVAPFAWPVPFEAVIAARDSFARAAIAYVRSRGVDVSADAEALWLALPHLIADFCYIFQSAAAGAGLACGKWQAEFGEAAEIAAGRPIGLSPRIEFALRLPGGQPHWRRALRLGKMLLSRGDVVSKPPYAIDRQHDVVTFQALPNLFRQAREEGMRRVVISRFDDWMAAANPVDDRRQRGMPPAVAVEYRQMLIEAFGAGRTALTDQVADILLRSADMIVRRTQSQIEQLRRKEKRLPLHFWSGTGGNLMNRVFGRMVAKSGGHVTAFDHGMSTGLWDSWAQTILEFNWADRFVTFSEAMADGLRRNQMAEYMARSGHVCRIVVAGKPMTEATQNKPAAPAATRQAVYVPTLYAGRSTQIIPLLPDIVAVDWQARLLNFLTQEGWGVSFKPHPESYCMPPEAFRHLGVQFETDLFESLPATGATLIFDYPQSTAFRSALLSREPIIFIDLPRLPLQAGVREMLTRRCAIVRGWFDVENRVQVDWSEMRAALAAAPSRANDHTVQNALFPVEQTRL